MLAVGGAHTRARRHVSPDAMPAHHPLDPLAADTLARGTQFGMNYVVPHTFPDARHEPAGYRSAVRDWRSRAGSPAVIARRDSPRAIRRVHRTGPALAARSNQPPYMGVEVKRYVISECPFAMRTRCRSVVDLSEVEPARTHAEHRSASPYIRSGPCP